MRASTAGGGLGDISLLLHIQFEAKGFWSRIFMREVHRHRLKLRGQGLRLCRLGLAFQVPCSSKHSQRCRHLGLRFQECTGHFVMAFFVAPNAVFGSPKAVTCDLLLNPSASWASQAADGLVRYIPWCTILDKGA